jgi:hypothetical protein
MEKKANSEGESSPLEIPNALGLTPGLLLRHLAFINGVGAGAGAGAGGVEAGAGAGEEDISAEIGRNLLDFWTSLCRGGLRSAFSFFVVNPPSIWSPPLRGD